ncbi:holin [Clostridium baratii]|uniref:phage holin n=1 Tax=Clostridium baratii TaxID=1561 RepID=UPI0009A38720|nr:phage holin [Clostridium baratii]OPF52537.1 holin [Clostridium baratii]OPF55985.1 holin [Clostridium baratii]OPF58421.1 holin [Clostridium baratii]OPF59633.1 holin [Clostridium baratii]
MLNIDMSRFKNYGLWVAIAALIPMVLKGFNIDILPDNYQEVINAILAILVMLGIISNPTTDNKGFVDDKTDVTNKK